MIIGCDCMKLKLEFVVNNIAGSFVAVPVGNNNDEFNGYIKLNDTGASIFNLLKEETTEDAIVSALLKEYTDASEEEARETVREFVGKLQDAGLLI